MENTDIVNKRGMGEKATLNTSAGPGGELIVGVGNDILVVDDDRVVLDYIKNNLVDDGYNIVLAENGVQAIKGLKGNIFNLLLVDKNLPDFTGLALIKMCREISPDTESILMTAHASLESAIEAINLGAYDYLLKPFDPSTLRDKVKRAIDHQKVKYENKVLLEFLKKANEELEASKAVLEREIQKRSEELKKANDGLRKFGKMREDLLTSVVKEMRALKERIVSYSSENGSRYSEALKEEGEKLSRIISEMEEISGLKVADIS